MSLCDLNDLPLMEKVVCPANEAEGTPSGSAFPDWKGGRMCYKKGWAYSFRKYSLGAYFVPDTVEGHMGED